MLSPYRVLDLSTNHSAVCGAMLADLGADVIAVEPLSGSPLRQEGPFRHDEPDAEHSLTWWSYSRNKRSVSLDITSAEGRAALLNLVDDADFLIESFAPGYLDSLGLGYSSLSERQPGLIMVSITPFGQEGPKSAWAASDLTIWASSGALNLTGDDDLAPVRVSVPQANLHAGAEAAVAALVALAARQRDGRGQHIDVSAQTASMMATQSFILAPAWNDLSLARIGGGLRLGPLFVRFVYPCKDGFVNITLLFGNVLGLFTRRLFEWLHEEGFVDEVTRDKDWVAYLQLLLTGEEPIPEFERAMAAIEQFTLSHTKAELFQGTFDRHVLIAPVSTPADIVDSSQLAARGYWQKLAHPVANELAAFPGPFARFSARPIEYRRRPPLLGEHAAEVKAERRHRPAPEPRQADNRPPLEGLRVCDFSWVYAAPAATRVLADWGATVVKVESTRFLDALRTGQPFKDGVVGPERSGGFCNVNVGKLGLALDLSKPEGRSVALRLADWADVVVENFSPSAMAAWGLDYATLSGRNRGLIMLSTCLSGSTGPHASLAGYGTMGAALTGFHELTGWPNRPPAGPFAAYTDYVSPKHVTASILAALDHRSRTGQGQHIDLSQAEASLHFLSPAILDYTVNQRQRSRDGNNSEECAPHGVFRCAGDDRWIAIAVTTQREFAAFCGAAGHPEWVNDERFALFPRRYANRALLEAMIGEWTSGRDVAELETVLQAAGVPAHRVSMATDVLTDPQLQARGHWAQIEQGEAGTVTVEAPRFRLSRSAFVPPHPAPTLGQHNDVVLRELLGMSDEAITELAVAGALE
ncbi:MAG: CoA transferase [Dehalococcoidia bacterium]|nr:CoA transferase [Dehalococcoidia bacterium]